MSVTSPLQFVRLTPSGRGAVATLLVAGTGAVDLIEASIRTPSGRVLRSYATDRLVFAHFGGSSGEEEVVVRRHLDGSVELHCHGGNAAVAMIEETLVARGCHGVAWQDWVVGRHADPIAAAAHIALAEARTQRTAAILLDQYQGALRQAFTTIEETLHGGDREAARRTIRRLLARAELGRHLVRPWRVVLAGRPNVGKSSLMNAVLGYSRAIVHHTPGTTRDRVTAATAVEGWPVELSDTAGLHAADDVIERAGIELARQQLATADLVVLVFDAGLPWTEAERALIEACPQGLVVHNKCDLPPSAEPRPEGLLTSAVTGQGVDRLVAAIAAALVPDPPLPGSAVPFAADQVAYLQRLLRQTGPDDPSE